MTSWLSDCGSRQLRHAELATAALRVEE